MSTFINPFTDFGFKRIFGQEDSKDILIGFLNALFEKELIVRDLIYKDKEQLGETANNRSLIYDIYCTEKSGKEFIVEMQNESQVHFQDRALYYASRAIVGQAKKGPDWQYSLKPVIGIYFMHFKKKQLKDRFRSDFCLREMATGKMLCNKLRLIFLQMTCFDKTQDQCTTDLDKWAYIMNHMETLDHIPWKAQNELFEKLEEMSKIAAMTEEQQAQYEAYLKQYRDNLAIQTDAERRGERRGKRIGEKIGEKNEKKRTARTMLTKGIDHTTISEITGLSMDEIKKLR